MQVEHFCTRRYLQKLYKNGAISGKDMLDVVKRVRELQGAAYVSVNVQVQDWFDGKRAHFTVSEGPEDLTGMVWNTRGRRVGYHTSDGYLDFH